MLAVVGPAVERAVLEDAGRDGLGVASHILFGRWIGIVVGVLGSGSVFPLSSRHRGQMATPHVLPAPCGSRRAGRRSRSRPGRGRKRRRDRGSSYSAWRQTPSLLVCAVLIGDGECGVVKGDPADRPRRSRRERSRRSRGTLAPPPTDPCNNRGSSATRPDDGATSSCTRSVSATRTWVEPRRDSPS